MFAFRPLLGIAAPLAAAVLSVTQPVEHATTDRTTTVTVAIDTTLLRVWRWRNIGPDRGGRSIAVSGVRGRRQDAYFGAIPAATTTTRSSTSGPCT